MKKQIDIIIDRETWDTEDKEPSIFSFFELVSFYEINENLKPASITINNDGYFVATWLSNIAQKIVESTSKIGVIPKIKLFLPHLTLCRVSSCENGRLRELIDKYKEEEFGSQVLIGFSLVKSITAPSGAEYSIIKEFNFRGH